MDFVLKDELLQKIEAGTMFVENGHYKVRDLIKIPYRDFENFPEAAITSLEFDDGIIQSSSREIVYSRLLWELYRFIPDPAVLKHHHVGRGQNRRAITPNTDSEILNDIIWNSKDKAIAANNLENFDIELLCEESYRICDKIDSFVRRKLGSYVRSVNYLDFCAFLEDKDIKQAHQDLQDNPNCSKMDIAKVYRVVESKTENPGDLATNVMTLACKSKSIKIPSWLKIVGANGFVTDVDSYIFPYAIKSNFARGLNTLIEIAIESRTSAMSIYYQTDAMQESEYFTRRTQEIGARIWRVHKGVDCKTPHYEAIFIPEKASLDNFMGAWYLDEETGQEKPILSKTEDIRGRVIKLRSPLHCQHPDRTGVCERCYGMIAESIMPGDSIGHLAPTSMQKQQTQRILSNKHLVATASAELYVPLEGEKKYVTVPIDSSDIFLNKNLAGKDVRITFSGSSAKNLQDIMFVDDLNSISPTRLTQIEALRFDLVKNHEIIDSNTIRPATEARIPYFTTEMLEHFRKVGWYTNEAGDFEVSLADWDVTVPMLRLPMVSLSTPKHMYAVRDMIITSAKRKANGDIDHEGYQKAIAKAPTPSAAFQALYDLVSSSLKVNIAHLQIIVLSMMVEDLDNGDYRVPLNKHYGQMGSFSDIMCKSDVSLAIAYENHYNYLFSRLDSFTIKHRHPHPSTNLLMG